MKKIKSIVRKILVEMPVARAIAAIGSVVLVRKHSLSKEDADLITAGLVPALLVLLSCAPGKKRRVKDQVIQNDKSPSHSENRLEIQDLNAVDPEVQS